MKQFWLHRHIRNKDALFFGSKKWRSPYVFLRPFFSRRFFYEPFFGRFFVRPFFFRGAALYMPSHLGHPFFLRRFFFSGIILGFLGVNFKKSSRGKTVFLRQFLGCFRLFSRSILFFSREKNKTLARIIAN